MSKSITLEFDIAKDLIETKQGVIRKEINDILKKWNITNPDEFIEKVEKGEILEGEHDAILLTNFLDELKSLELLLN